MGQATEAELIAVVQRQLDAYNAHDAYAFAKCFADEIAITREGSTKVFTRAEFCELYRKQFANYPTLVARVLNRVANAEKQTVTDHEEAKFGGDRGTVVLFAEYRIDVDHISAVVFTKV